MKSREHPRDVTHRRRLYREFAKRPQLYKCLHQLHSTGAEISRILPPYKSAGVTTSPMSEGIFPVSPNERNDFNLGMSFIILDVATPADTPTFKDALTVESPRTRRFTNRRWEFSGGLLRFTRLFSVTLSKQISRYSTGVSICWKRLDTRHREAWVDL